MWISFLLQNSQSATIFMKISRAWFPFLDLDNYCTQFFTFLFLLFEIKAVSSLLFWCGLSLEIAKKLKMGRRKWEWNIEFWEVAGWAWVGFEENFNITWTFFLRVELGKVSIFLLLNLIRPNLQVGFAGQHMIFLKKNIFIFYNKKILL